MTREQKGQQANVGVFVCECGEKIAGCLDVPSLVRQVGELPGVGWAGQAGYWCSEGNLERMKQVITDQRLDRVVIAGCAPRTHEGYFRQALGKVNPTWVNVANLRDLVAQPHRDDPPAAAAKARDQVAMAVAEVTERAASEPRLAHITPHALVIGGGIAGMTAALGLSEAGISVTLVERRADLGGLARLYPLDGETAAVVEQCAASVGGRPNIQTLTSTQVTNVSGPVGGYQIDLSNGQVVEAGAIIVATGGQINFKSQISDFKFKNTAFVLCDMTPEGQAACLHSCCLTTCRQAAEFARRNAASQVTVFFRELYTAGGAYNDLVWEAQQQGVNLVRYPSGHGPQLVDGEVVAFDELAGREVRMPCDQFVTAEAIKPHDDAAQLATLLRLPVDANGFLAEARVRLRPSDRIERGIYVCGAAHYPCDVRRATFEAYSAAARAAQHIRRKQATSWASPAVVDAARCNGCGDCVKVCPFMAITLVERQGDKKTGRPGDRETRRLGGKEMPPLAVIDELVCTGCGNCVSVCPVKAAQVATSYDEQIEAQIRAAMGLNGQGDQGTRGPGDQIPYLIFACEWSGYSAAEIAGASGLVYPASTRIIRLNCTGRLQPGLILKALEMGAAGVLILGCAPGVCHYEQGNERCVAMFEQANALAHLMGLDHKLRLEWIPPDDGARFVQVINDFIERRLANNLLNVGRWQVVGGQTTHNE